MAQRWAVPLSVRLHWRDLGDAFAVYNPSSGQSHVLNASAAALLRSLEKSPATSAELAQEIIDVSCEQPPAEFDERVAGLLSDLDEVGLIERIQTKHRD